MYDRNRYLSATLEVHFSNSNTTIMAYVVDPDSTLDYNGALYYVVVVVLIYALSIVMMIASHIRKNQQDSQLRTYLKEMAILRKNDKRDKIMGRIGTFAKTTTNNDESCGSAKSSTVSPDTPNERMNLLPTDPSTRNNRLTVGNSDIEVAKKTTQVFASSPKRSFLPNLTIQVIDENTPL